MLVGIQMHITFDIDFDTLADALGVSEEEVERLWSEGELKETLDETMDTYEILGLCSDPDYYSGARVGGVYH